MKDNVKEFYKYLLDEMKSINDELEAFDPFKDLDEIHGRRYLLDEVIDRFKLTMIESEE